MDEILVQGRRLTAADVEEIRQLIAAHPDWSRWRCSRALCEQWDWRNGAGWIKDMAARSLLVKLQERGQIELPTRRRRVPNRMRGGSIAVRSWDMTPVVGSLADLG